MMESVGFSVSWLEIAAAVYLAGMILYGHYRGFIRLAVSAAALLITMVVVNLALPYVTDWLKYDTPIYETAKTKLEETIGLDKILGELGANHNPQKEEQWKIIEELPIPQQMKTLLVENNNIEVYKTMGIELFQDYVGEYLADAIFKAAVFIVLFLAVFVVLQFLVFWLDLIAKLPVLSGMNKIAGAILGGVEALAFLWIICLLFTAFSGTEIGASLLRQVESSIWLSWIYDHNLCSYLVMAIIRLV